MSGARVSLGLVAAVALAVVVAGFVFTLPGRSNRAAPTINLDPTTTPPPAIAADLVAAGVQSFTVTSVTRWSRSTPEQTLQFFREETLTYRRPGNWRRETISTGRDGQRSHLVFARSSGDQGWTWRPGGSVMTRGAGSPGGFIRPIAPYEFGSPSLDYVVEQLTPCYAVPPPAEEAVAGRPAYRLDLDPRCRDFPGTRYNGPRTLWLDRETLFVLRERIVDRDDGSEVYFREVTEVHYNVALDDDLFQPPAGLVPDMRKFGGLETPYVGD